MRVEGREIAVAGSLLQPLIRRTSALLRVVASAVALAAVVAGSLITRNKWTGLERSVSDIVGVLTPGQSNLAYLLYSIAIFALPFMILLALIIGRKWKLLAGYAAAGLVAVLALSISGSGISRPKWHLHGADHLDTFLSQFLDDPRWIAMLAAGLTVAGPWLPARRRRAWWTLLLAFVPIHLAVSLVVPANTMLGLAVGWFIGALIVWVVGTPALEVPLEGAVEALALRGHTVTALTVLRPAGPGPLVLAADCEEGPLFLELYGPNQRSGGAIRQLWRWLTLRASETPPWHASMRRAIEHRALMSLAVGNLGLSANVPVPPAVLDRGWTLYGRNPARGRPVEADSSDLDAIWKSLCQLQSGQISHGDLRIDELHIDDGTALFGGFSYAELGVTDAQLQSDRAQLLLTTAGAFGPEQAVRAAVDAVGVDAVLAASGRLTKSAIPLRVRRSVPDVRAVMSATREEVLRHTGTDRIEAERVTRFTRTQAIQLVLLVGLVYVAYPFISTVPTFFSELAKANWGFALLGLLVSALTYVGAAAALWACASGAVRFRNLVIMQVANTFAATTTPAGVGGLALSVRCLQRGGLGAVRATAAVALQQTVQVITHVTLLIIFSVAAGASTNLAHLVPSATVLYLVAGVALGGIGAALFVPQLRRWLGTAVRPKLTEVLTELADLVRDPRRLSVIVLGCAATTLGAALALWLSVEAFGGNTTFIAVTVVTMIGGTLASAAPTPGGVGAVEAALIGGLAAFGLPAAIAVPSVLLYRVLTCWLPVFLGWPTMRWLTARDLI